MNLLKPITIWVLFIYVLNINAILLLYFSHKINIAYIIQNLCVQKDEPENLCGGSCQLKTKLETEEDQNKEKKSENISSQTIVLSPHTSKTRTECSAVQSNRLHYFIHDVNKTNIAELPPDTPPPQFLSFV